MLEVSEIENSDNDDELDVNAKSRLARKDDYHDDSDESTCDKVQNEEEKDIITFGVKRKGSSMQGQPSNKKAKNSERKSREIFVKNLPLGCNEEDIRKDFADYDISITKIKLRGRANGKIAHITTVNEVSESDVLSLDGMVINDCPVIIELAVDKSKVKQRKSKNNKNKTKLQVCEPKGPGRIEDAKKLFIKNLNWNVTEDTLREHFDCREVHIPKAADGTTRGFAFLKFATKEAATKALEDLQDITINGRIIKLDRVAASNKRKRKDGLPKGLHIGNPGRSIGKNQSQL